MYIQVTSDEQLDQIKKTYDFVVLFITSIQCSACLSCKDQVIDRYQNDPNIMLVVDDVARPGFSNDKYNLKNLPAFILYFDNQEVGRFSTANMERITRYIDGVQQKINEVKNNQMSNITSANRTSITRTSITRTG